jgi:hypothetical protein
MTIQHASVVAAPPLAASSPPRAGGWPIRQTTVTTAGCLAYQALVGGSLNHIGLVCKAGLVIAAACRDKTSPVSGSVARRHIGGCP